MLGLGLRRKPRRIGRHEGERRCLVAAVLRQVEVHAPDQVPRRIEPLQKALQIRLRRSKRLCQRRRGVPPQPAQHIRREIFGPRHHGRRQHKRREFGLVRRRYGRKAGGRRGAGVRAGRLQTQRCDVTRGKSAPPQEDRRQGLTHLDGAKLQQPEAAAARECVAYAPANALVDLRGVCGRFEGKVAVRRKPETRTGHARSTMDRWVMVKIGQRVSPKFGYGRKAGVQNLALSYRKTLPRNRSSGSSCRLPPAALRRDARDPGVNRWNGARTARKGCPSPASPVTI